MLISPQTTLLLLLTQIVPDTQRSVAVAPLSFVEYERVAAWLRKRAVPPAGVLDDDPALSLAGWSDPLLPLDRLAALLERRPALTATVARWQGDGIWAIGRSDQHYPRRLKRRLGDEAPLVLFGQGEAPLLNRGGIGLRAAEDAPDGSEFASSFAGMIAGATLSVVTTSRHDGEETAWRTALANGGDAVVVVAGDLEAPTSRERFGRAAVSGHCVLVSAIPPGSADAEAWPVAERCAYALSDATLLMAPGHDRVLRAAAVEALERRWVPVWIRDVSLSAVRRPGVHEIETGAQIHRTLVQLGALPLPSGLPAPRSLLAAPAILPPAAGRRHDDRPPHRLPAFMTGLPGAPRLVGFAEQPEPFGGSGSASHGEPQPAERTGPHLRLVPSQGAASSTDGQPAGDTVATLYDVFLNRLLGLLHEAPRTADVVARALDLTNEQTRVWLDRAQMTGRTTVDPAGKLSAAPPVSE